MGKLVIKYQGRVVNEVSLKLGDTRIGRKPECDIVLDDATVSSEHAVIRTVGTKSTVHDLDSKNGTFIENRRVTQHPLQHGETVIIGGYALTYRDGLNLDSPAVFAGASAAPKASGGAINVTTELVHFAQLVAVDGPNKGRHVPLIQDVVTIDNPGKSPARITRLSDGYLLEASVGPGEPKVNDRPVPPGGHLLEKGDVVDVAGTKYQLSL